MLPEKSASSFDGATGLLIPLVLCLQRERNWLLSVPTRSNITWHGFEPWPHVLIWISTCITATRPHLRNTLELDSEWSSIGIYRCLMDTHIHSCRTSPN